MPHYCFTVEDRQRGGWARARQKAGYRRAHPTEAEKSIRALCNQAGLSFVAEYEIWNDFGPYPQWFDIYIPQYNLAIEIDGSQRWHDRRYPSSKMYDYDTAKQMYCDYHHITLVVLHEWEYSLDEFCAIVQPFLTCD
jgi:hypothetical protein